MEFTSSPLGPDNLVSQGRLFNCPVSTRSFPLNTQAIYINIFLSVGGGSTLLLPAFRDGFHQNRHLSSSQSRFLRPRCELRTNGVHHLYSAGAGPERSLHNKVAAR